MECRNLDVCKVLSCSGQCSRRSEGAILGHLDQQYFWPQLAIQMLQYCNSACCAVLSVYAMIKKHAVVIFVSCS